MMPAWRKPLVSPLRQMAGSEVLITGGLGFIGSNLAQVLVRHGACVTIVDCLADSCGGSMDNIRNLRGLVRVDCSDLCERLCLQGLVRGKDYIFHLAGQSSHAGSMDHPVRDLEANCMATANLLETCRRTNPRARVVFTSTRQVYGRTQALPVNEEHPTLPVDVNGIHKLAAERYMQIYHTVHGLPTTVLRLTNTYGPRQKLGDPRLGVTALFIHQALGGRTLRLFGGQQLRDFNHVDDVTAALILAATREECCGGVFNLGASRANTLREFAQTLQHLCGCTLCVVPFPEAQQAIDIGDYHADFSRFQKATGWAPRISLEEGLIQTLDHYRMQGPDRSGSPARRVDPADCRAVQAGFSD
jgi:UDP-glucose 4-epimerase